VLAHYEVGFRLRHNCPFNNLSKKYPSVVLAWWTNFDQDVLEASYGGSDIPDGYREYLGKAIEYMGGRIVRNALTNSKLQMVINWDGTKREYSTSRAFMKRGCLVLQPTVHTEGWEHYRVVAFSDKDVKDLFGDLDKRGEVQIVSKKAVEEGSVKDNLVISAASILGDLTGNQAEALLLALDSGYYSIPKSITTEKVAARMGLPRTTFEEHLRKAESKVLLSVAPYVRLSAKKGRSARPSPYAQQSEPRTESGRFESLAFEVSSPRKTE
jgi:predicted DNA binding protein